MWVHNSLQRRQTDASLSYAKPAEYGDLQKPLKINYEHSMPRAT